MRSNNGYVWVGVQKRSLFLQPLRDRDVVGIHDGDVGGRGQADSFVERGGKAAIFPAYDPHSAVAGCEALEDPARCIRRAIINCDEFEIRQRLRKDAFHRLPDIGLGVEDR